VPLIIDLRTRIGGSLDFRLGIASGVVGGSMGDGVQGFVRGLRSGRKSGIGIWGVGGGGRVWFLRFG
jgi:hypothetical protein